MSHTPGPWIVRDVGYGAHVGDVAWVGFGTARSKEEHLANARLMASAPELLEACRLLVQWDETDNTGESENDFWKGYAKAVDAARSAIASAMRTESNEGKQC